MLKEIPRKTTNVEATLVLLILLPLPLLCIVCNSLNQRKLLVNKIEIIIAIQLTLRLELTVSFVK